VTTDNGWVDFGPHVVDEVRVDGLQGNNSSDFDLADRAAGYTETPDGYTWHHHPDGCTMQLVPTELHNAWYHVGGASRIRNGLGGC
jgi:hypothetical protein